MGLIARWRTDHQLTPCLPLELPADPVHGGLDSLVEADGGH